MYFRYVTFGHKLHISYYIAMICAIAQIYCYKKKLKSELKKAQILSERRKADLLHVAATKDGEKMEHILAFGFLLAMTY